MNILFLTDKALSKEEIFMTAKLCKFSAKGSKLLVLEKSNLGECDRLLSEADTIVTNMTRLTEKMLEQASNLLLIGCLGKIDQLIETAAERKGILMVGLQSNQQESKMASKLQNLQTIFAEIDRFIKGEPLLHVIRICHSSTN